MRIFPVRLSPGADLVEWIEKWIVEKQCKSGVILSCLGSLTSVSIRYANQPESTPLEGHFEILSLSGFLSIHGSHIHIGISDNKGACIGGHLAESAIIYTTCEMVIAIIEDKEFLRTYDPESGYPELDIRDIKGDAP